MDLDVRAGGPRTLPWWLAVVAAVAVAAIEANALFDFHLEQERLPKWDMAMNGWQGHQLALDLKSGDLLEFFVDLNKHERFPFGHSLLVIPFSLVAGPTYAAATLATTLLFVLMPFPLLALARRIDNGPVRFWAGLIAAALLLTSPMLRLFSILIMREIPGAFFSLVAVACYVRALERDMLPAWRMAGLSALSFSSSNTTTVSPG